MIVVRQILRPDPHGQLHADAVPVPPFPVKGHVSVRGRFGLGPVRNAHLQRHADGLRRVDRKEQALPLRIVPHPGGHGIDALLSGGIAGQMEGARLGIPPLRHGDGLPVDLRPAGGIKELAGIDHPAVLIVHVSVMGRVGLHQGAVAAVEVILLAGPALPAARAHGQEIGQQPAPGAVVPDAVIDGFLLPVGLRHNAVVEVPLDIIAVALVPRPAEQIIRQPHHVVNRAVLLGLVAQAGPEFMLRRPDLAQGLPAGHIRAAVGHGAFPVGLADPAPLFLPGDLIRPGAAAHLGNGGVGVHVGQGILPRQQRVKQAAAVIPDHQGSVHLPAGDAVEIRPDLQHAAGFHVQDIVHLLPGEGRRPVQEPFRPALGNRQRLFIARVSVHVHQAHKDLMERVLRRPDGLALRNPEQVFLRNRAGPAVAVLQLALLQDIDHVVRLRLDGPVPGGMIAHGRGGQPVAREMAPQLAAGILPAAVHPGKGFRRAGQTRLHLKIQHQRPGLQAQHIIPVLPLAALQLAVKELHIPALKHFQCHPEIPPIAKDLLRESIRLQRSKLRKIYHKTDSGFNIPAGGIRKSAPREGPRAPGRTALDTPFALCYKFIVWFVIVP